MKGEKSNERPYLEQNDQLEFNGETRKLHLFMKNLLTTNGLVLILNESSLSVPAAVHQIEAREDDLDNDEVDRLKAD